MPRQFVIAVRENGDLEYIYSDDLRFLAEDGQAETRRASHVEPDASGGWTADMSPTSGPVLGPFDTRAEALAMETAWLNAHYLS